MATFLENGPEWLQVQLFERSSALRLGTAVSYSQLAFTQYQINLDPPITEAQRLMKRSGILVVIM